MSTLEDMGTIDNRILDAGSPTNNTMLGLEAIIGKACLEKQKERERVLGEKFKALIDTGVKCKCNQRIGVGKMTRFKLKRTLFHSSWAPVMKMENCVQGKYMFI